MGSAGTRHLHAGRVFGPKPQQQAGQRTCGSAAGTLRVQQQRPRAFFLSQSGGAAFCAPRQVAGTAPALGVPGLRWGGNRLQKIHHGT